MIGSDYGMQRFICLDGFPGHGPVCLDDAGDVAVEGEWRRAEEISWDREVGRVHKKMEMRQWVHVSESEHWICSCDVEYCRRICL